MLRCYFTDKCTVNTAYNNDHKILTSNQPHPTSIYGRSGEKIANKSKSSAKNRKEKKERIKQKTKKVDKYSLHQQKLWYYRLREYTHKTHTHTLLALHVRPLFFANKLHAAAGTTHDPVRQ